MKIPGRNDPCSCGSGKKYKKCCGESNVVDFNPQFYTGKFIELQEKVMRYAMDHFDDEFAAIRQDYLSSYVFNQSDQKLVHMYLTLALNWAIFNEPLAGGQTIFDSYYQKEHHKIKNPTVKNAFALWHDPSPGFYKVMSVDEESDLMTIKDMSTSETYECLKSEATDDHVGAFIVGVLVPYVNIHAFFLTSVMFPPESETYIATLLAELKKHNFDLNELFPDVLADVMGLQEDVDSVESDELEWADPLYEDIAELFVTTMRAKNRSEDTIEEGFLFWLDYCNRQLPEIRRIEAHAAALDYLMQDVTGDKPRQTQADIAKEYGTSPTAISNNYKNMKRDYYTGDHSFDDDDDGVNPYEIEQNLQEMQRLLQSRDFESEEEMIQFLNEAMESVRFPVVDKSARDQAQDLLYEAYSAHGDEQKELIDAALAIYPNSPDAYVLLADSEPSLEKGHELLRKAVVVGEKDLGEAFFNENMGRFWGIIETRPYLRAKAAYATSLAMLDFEAEAAEECEEILMLNPNDNLGMRELLLSLYMENDEYTQAKRILEKYAGDASAAFLFTNALIEYELNGVTKQTLDLLALADKQHPFVIDYLTDKRQFPDDVSDSFAIGSDVDAMQYIDDNYHLWMDAKELVLAYVPTRS